VGLTNFSTKGTKQVDEKTKHEIAQMVANIIYKKYNGEVAGEADEKEIKKVVELSLDRMRSGIATERLSLETEAINRLRRRFASEVEPMIANIDTKITNYFAGYGREIEDTFNSMLKEELVRALRARAKEWAKKVATAEVSFSFNKVFREDKEEW